MLQTPRDDDQKLPTVRRYQFTVRTLLALPVVVGLYGAAATLPRWRVTAVLAVTWGIFAAWSLWRRAFYQLGGLCAGLVIAPVTWILLSQPFIAESGATPLEAGFVVALITGIILGLVQNK